MSDFNGMMRVRMVSQGWQGAPGLSTFYFMHAGGFNEPNGDDCLNCCERVQAAMNDASDLWPVAWNGKIDQVVDIIDAVTGDLTASFTVDDQAAVAGTNGSGFGPIPVALLLRYSTTSIIEGRRVLGRAFLSPIGPYAHTDGTPTATAVTNGNLFGSALLDAGGSGNQLCVWQRPRDADAEHLPEPVTQRDGSWHGVTAIQVPDRFSILRSRRD